MRRDIGAVYVQMFDTAVANWYGEPGGMCVHAETCGSQLALEHTGDLYSCDHYVEPGYLLGNIKDKHMLELIASPQQAKFGQDKRDALTRYCRDCGIRFACNGGCPKDRFATSPYGEPGQHYLCPGYKAFFRHVTKPMDTMAMLLRAGQAPAELMAPRRTPGAAATTPAPAPAAANGNAATALLPTLPQPSDAADFLRCPVPVPPIPAGRHRRRRHGGPDRIRGHRERPCA